MENNAKRPGVDDILKKYGAKIEKEMKGFDSSKLKSPQGSGAGGKGGKFSKSYEEFRSSMIPSFTSYEKWAKALGNFFKINLSGKDRGRIEKNISIARLNLTASEVVVFAFSVLVLTLFGGIFGVVAIWLFSGVFSFMLTFLVVLFSVFLFYYSYKAPERLAQKWRLKASSQMVPAILYVVVYMKHTSNFEKAIAFAAEHLTPPLSLDFRKIFWDVEVGKFSTIKESVDHYLEGWRDYSTEFIESFHLIESSLYEPNEHRRIAVLEKALQVILDGIYDKMLKYTHSVKSPLTNLYMLGIVLPTLALALLPLVSTLMQGAIKAYHVFFIFNLLIPFFVIYLTGRILTSRPGGYGETSLLELNPLYPKYKSNKPYLTGILFALPFFLIGSIPFLLRYTGIPTLLGIQRDYSWSSLGMSFMGEGGIFGIMETSEGLVGPFGPISLILSLFIPLAIAIVFIVAYKTKTKDLIKSRERYKEVEKEFTSSLFQLGNRMGDGVPAEIAFLKVGESSKGTSTEGFFKIVNENIHQLGMSLDQALFNPKRGAVIFFPSQLVATSMKILTETVRKGLKIAARSLMSISEYVKNIRKIDARLDDLLADIVSDMKSNMTFLAPLLAGIIIGLAGMITAILGNLSALFSSGGLGGGTGGIAGAGGIEQILGIFDITKMMPTYWLQIVVGLYIIEIVFILTSTLVTIKSGRDELYSTAETGINLKRSILLYLIVALFAIVGLSLIGSVALAGLG
jgi:hypothetical protein